jgi:hypothetical protein
MKHIHKKYLLIAMSIGIVLSSCQKGYLDVNTDPNRVTDVNVTPELIFPAAAEAVGASMNGARASEAGAKTTIQFAFSWVGYQAANGDFARDPTETSYNLDFSFNNTLWIRRYDMLFDLHQTEVKAIQQGDTVLAGCAIVLAAKEWQEVVDLWGDIPYSKAFQVVTNPTPAYDKAQDIYNNLELRLDTAILYLSQAASKKFTAAVDIVNQADQTKWIKFANTLKLRLLIRQSEVPGFSPAAEIAKIFGGSSPGVLGSGESVSENPGYLNDVNKQNPFFANYGFTTTGVVATTSQQANAYMVNILQSTLDPRIGFFYTPKGGAFVGDVYGDEPGNIPSGANSSYFGPGIVMSSAQDQWVMPAFESMFLKAEAAARGWIAINADTAYMQAVQESFEWLYTNAGLSKDSADNDFATYMDNNAGADFTANAGSTPLSKAQFIAFQKYIAMCCIDPLEAYADQRRLNFLPSAVGGVSYISANPSKVSNSIPERLLYPQSEYTTNAANVNKEGTINQFTSKLFWEP